MTAGFVKITKDCTVGTREFVKGQVVKVTAEEFWDLVKTKSALPTGERGRPLTADMALRKA